LSPIFVVELSHGGVVFSAGAGVNADMQTYWVADAEPDPEPDAEPDVEPGAEPDVEPGAEPDVTAVGVGRLVALLVVVGNGRAAVLNPGSTAWPFRPRVSNPGHGTHVECG
jgi:hypothetical protein